MSLRPVFAQTVTSISNSDSSVVTIVGDISHGIFKELREKHPQRYFNIGICEPSMLSVASGLSASGLIPVVHTITPFLIERSYEQIKLGFAYQNLSVNLVSVGGSFEYSKLGCTHHCYSDYSLLSKLPNTQVFFPGSPREFEKLFVDNYANGMINYFRLTEYPHEVNTPQEISSGTALTLSTGDDITFFVCGGPSLNRAVAAVDVLRGQGIRVEVVYFHTLMPFDCKVVVDSAFKTRKFLVIEENHESDGLYSLILKSIQGEFTFEAIQIAVRDFVRDYGTYNYLTSISGLSVERIVEASKELLGGKLQ